MRPSAIHALLALLYVLIPHPVLAQETSTYFETQAGFSTGDFGTDTTSNLYYLNSTLGYISEGYDFSITLPYVYLTNDTDGQRYSESGIGDIILHAGLVLIPQEKDGLYLNGGLATKLPAADETSGLGTGQADYGAFLELGQSFGAFTLALTGGYIKVGDPDSLDYNDIFLYNIEISKVFDNTHIYASLEGRRSILPGATAPMELNLGIFHTFNRDYSLTANTFIGLTDGAPDFGFETGIVRWF